MLILYIPDRICPCEKCHLYNHALVHYPASAYDFKFEILIKLK